MWTWSTGEIDLNVKIPQGLESSPRCICISCEHSNQTKFHLLWDYHLIISLNILLWSETKVPLSNLQPAPKPPIPSLSTSSKTSKQASKQTNKQTKIPKIQEENAAFYKQVHNSETAQIPSMSTACLQTGLRDTWNGKKANKKNSIEFSFSKSI